MLQGPVDPVNLIADNLCTARMVLLHDNGEFVASNPQHVVVGTEIVPEKAGSPDQGTVACLMAIVVIDGFEDIHINQQQRYGVRNIMKTDLQLFEGFPVQQTGQGIGLCLVAEHILVGNSHGIRCCR